MPPKTELDEDLVFLWTCLKNLKNSDKDFKALGIDYDAVAKVYNINKGATSKRFSRLKIALDAATEATTNGKDDTLEASKSPEKGTKRKALTNSGEDTGKKRKAKAAGRGSKKKKAKIEEAVGEDEDEGGKNIKAEEGSEDDALDLNAEIDPFYD